MPVLEVTMPPLHPAQAQVARDPHRYIVLVAGRRWGKTMLGVAKCVEAALLGGRAWWVAPTYIIARVGWRLLLGLSAQVPGVEIRRGDRIITYPGGGSVAVRSSDRPDSLRSEGLDYVVLDEAAFQVEDVWTHALRPALSDRRGKALFISTPKGRNWLWKLWLRGQDESWPEWASFRFPTSTNPYIPPEEIEEARASLPEPVFRQEYLAEFVDVATSVFRNVYEVATAAVVEEPEPGHRYVFGIDWGAVQDYTAVVVLDTTAKSVVWVERLQGDYVAQAGRVKRLAEHYRPDVIVAEANAMGRAVIDMLERMGVSNIRPFTTTPTSKAEIISELALAFQAREIRIIPDQELITELLAFEVRQTPAGRLRYEAASGFHDDLVMALAMAWSAGVADIGRLLL